ncbi:ankyrin repeat-containing protein BDA1-like [Dioscorea cayenensis subsp. rotundata]|uniref:Ankyrin repeat-containing protein BDA1-like n=1 Tax=Dioscorea cayennensis subsp. rotundata TaxID=55577 RepID=A0AB40BLX1_DIOCR|nr:ankyrin repeat-containing protein BDA1-like [Dioscorea cayenensis subsp. rotundata]
MDPRLEKACHTGNLSMFHGLLQEDKLLLHRFSSIITASIDNPLHIAVSLGHTDLANEIIIGNPDLSSDLNPRTLSALHLASAHGHLEIVKLLISKVGSNLCFLKDKDGRLAIHIAATKGRIDILEELIKICPESARALTYQHESILHLAVQSNSFETIEFLVNKLEDDGDINELFNLKDDKGNTILHHAVARRQLQSVKLLLSKGDVAEVNAMNDKGLTALDVLLDSPREYGDLALGEVIRVAGGKIASEMDPQQTSLETNTSRNESSGTTTPPSRSWVSRLFGGRRGTRLQRRTKKHDEVEDDYTPGTLMVVATLIATITFQSGLNPPGGFTQDNGKNTTADNSSNASTPPGLAILRSKLDFFLLYDMIGLFASLSIILILICMRPRKKKIMMKILVVVMWVAVFFTALAFASGIDPIFGNSTLSILGYLVSGWFLLLAIFSSSVFLLVIVYLLRKVGWWRKKEGDKVSNIVRNGGCLLRCMRIGVVIIILLFSAFLSLIYWQTVEVSRVETSTYTRENT